jgi:hypothetical protein
MELVYFLVAYRRKLRLVRNGRPIFFKSRIVCVDSFVSCGDTRTDIKKAFERAESSDLFRRGWSVICWPIERQEYLEHFEASRCHVE